jgi:hypothetical protein
MAAEQFPDLLFLYDVMTVMQYKNKVTYLHLKIISIVNAAVAMFIPN